MNFKLFTSDDYRENVLKHVKLKPNFMDEIRGGSNMFNDSYSHEVNGDTVTPPAHSSGFDSPLSTVPSGSLRPHEISYSNLTSECYAQELLDELNYTEVK